MSRPRSGIGFLQRGVLYTGVRLPDGRRWVRPVAQVAPPPDGVGANVTWARAVSLQLQARFDRGEWRPDDLPSTSTRQNAPAPAGVAPLRRAAVAGTETALPGGRPTRAIRAASVPSATARVPAETVAAWFNRWNKDRAERELSSSVTDGYRFRGHVEPVLGHLLIGSVTKADIERVVARLDAETKGGQSWKTSLNSWALVRAMFRDAARSKNAALRVRDDNPCLDVAPPDRGPKKVKQYIAPAEFLALVSCDALPLTARRLYAIAVYLYARPGELEALEWSDFDLDRGTVHIHRAVHYDTAAVKPVKTQEARRFSVERNLLPLLRAMHDARGDDVRMIPGAVPKDGAKLLRDHLQVAGVTRAALFASSKTCKSMTFYDLRATGITWRAIRGDDPLRIQRAAGHGGFDTTQGYIREAESVREDFGEVFPALPAGLITGFGAERRRALRSDAVRRR